MIQTNIRADGELKQAAEKLLDAAHEYHLAYRKAGGNAAVVWVQDSQGRLVVMTRGEYRNVIMDNIPYCDTDVRFDQE